jgi:hypothetical protein
LLAVFVELLSVEKSSKPAGCTVPSGSLRQSKIIKRAAPHHAARAHGFQVAFHQRSFGRTGLPSTSTGSSSLAIKDKPLGDFALMCETRSGWAFFPASETCPVAEAGSFELPATVPRLGEQFSEPGQLGKIGSGANQCSP